jgi:hypothetical protein
MGLQPIENKALSRDIIGKSAPTLAEITIRKSQNRVFDERLDRLLLHIGKHVDDDLTTPLHHAKHGWPLFLRCTTAPFAFEAASATFASLGLHHLRVAFMASNHIGFVALYFV